MRALATDTAKSRRGLGRTQQTGASQCMKHGALEDSELIYGLAPTMAVLQQGKRKVHTVFLQKATQRDIARPRLDEICRMAKEQGIPIIQRSRKFLDNASADGSHQGVAVQADPLKTPEVLAMLGASGSSYQIETAEGRFQLQARRRHPLWVAISSIYDHRNLGSVIRSALFFGADALLVPLKHSARPTPVVSKSSSGAMECLDIYATKSMSKVLASAQKARWKIVCATADSKSTSASVVTTDELPQLSGPVVVVIGNESVGIPPDISELSDINVHIAARAETPSHIDSLNAGVAAGIVLASVKFADE
ncbi:hypothetical protein H4R22_002059 [Coemansia sp. RSA 1290]|nr:hypothetical protein H4R22_002059 [Coemansia sp. RSA 1290]KAJ2648745.1 hypothetical protein IWW40_003688 [Coemansia sp. RSA 1250]